MEYLPPEPEQTYVQPTFINDPIVAVMAERARQQEANRIAAIDQELTFKSSILTRGAIANGVVYNIPPVSQIYRLHSELTPILPYYEYTLYMAELTDPLDLAWAAAERYTVLYLSSDLSAIEPRTSIPFGRRFKGDTIFRGVSIFFDSDGQFLPPRKIDVVRTNLLSEGDQGFGEILRLGSTYNIVISDDSGFSKSIIKKFAGTVSVFINTQRETENIILRPTDERRSAALRNRRMLDRHLTWSRNVARRLLA